MYISNKTNLFFFFFEPNGKLIIIRCGWGEIDSRPKVIITFKMTPRVRVLRTDITSLVTLERYVE